MTTTIERERKCVVHLAWSQDVNAKAFLGYARSADLKQDMNALLKTTLATLANGRGGGQAQMAQGGGSASPGEIDAALTAAEGRLREAGK